MKKQFDEIRELIKNEEYDAALGKILLFINIAEGIISKDQAEASNKLFNKYGTTSLFNISGGSLSFIDIMEELHFYNTNKSIRKEADKFDLDADFKLNLNAGNDNNIKLSKFINEAGKEMTLIELDEIYLINVLLDLCEKFFA